MFKTVSILSLLALTHGDEKVANQAAATGASSVESQSAQVGSTVDDPSVRTANKPVVVGEPIGTESVAYQYGVIETGYCYTCSGCSPNYGCQDCGGVAYCCCSGYNVCCSDGQSYCASSCSFTSATDDDDSCFSVDSIITYGGNAYSFEQLKNGAVAECVIPHVVPARGIVIETSCGVLDVTPTHLLWDGTSYKTALDFYLGDHLYNGSDENCIITSIQYKSEASEYFGLNCLDSDVLVNGMKASTFGNYHFVPATYMKYVGSFVGIQTASKVGETFASAFFQATSVMKHAKSF